MNMLRHYIKLAIRNLLKYKSQSVISIIGLAIGFTCFCPVYLVDTLRADLRYLPRRGRQDLSDKA